MGAYVVQKTLALFYFILLARFLGPVDLGKYIFALSFTVVFSIFIDFALSIVLTREVAKEKEKTVPYLSNILTFKLISGAICFFLLVLIINLLNYPDLTKILVYLAGLVLILDSFSNSFYQVFRGYLNLKYEALSIIGQKLVIVFLGLILIFLKQPLPILMLPVVFGSFFYFFWGLIIFQKKLHLPLYFSLDKKVLKILFSLTWPFFMAGIFSQIFGSIDTILLSVLVGDKFVGFYSAAQRLPVSLTSLIPAAFGAALFPAFSYWYKRSKETLNQIFEKSIFYLTCLSLPILFGTFILAPEIIQLIYGPGYQPSILSLKILISGLLFMFLDWPMFNLLNACDRQKITILCRGIAVLVLVGLNFLLIPKFFHLGSAIAALSAFSVLFLLEGYFVQKIIKIQLELIKKIIKIFLSTLIMAGAILFLKEKIHFLFLILIGTGIYFLILYLIKGITTKEIKEIKNLIYAKA